MDEDKDCCGNNQEDSGVSILNDTYINIGKNAKKVKTYSTEDFKSKKSWGDVLQIFNELNGDDGLEMEGGFSKMFEKQQDNAKHNLNILNIFCKKIKKKQTE